MPNPIFSLLARSSQARRHDEFRRPRSRSAEGLATTATATCCGGSDLLPQTTDSGPQLELSVCPVDLSIELEDDGHLDSDSKEVAASSAWFGASLELDLGQAAEESVHQVAGGLPWCSARSALQTSSSQYLREPSQIVRSCSHFQRVAGPDT